ncbi:hypothetical protein ACFY4B_27085 [Kitasatospora sp. NPDC001261]|uniref:hypothetical protein n=1 Tax=Kitasatospora sp. NPDC001261 TaxID=3364012 RepID=UPI0036B20C6A
MPTAPPIVPDVPLNELPAALVPVLSGLCPSGAGGYGASGSLTLTDQQVEDPGTDAIRAAVRKAAHSLGWTVTTFPYELAGATAISVKDNRPVPEQHRDAVEAHRQKLMREAVEQVHRRFRERTA